MTSGIVSLRRAFVHLLNSTLPRTPFFDRLVGLPGFYSHHRRLPRRPDHPQAWISDILFSRARSDDWTPLQRLCVDKVTAVDVARAAAPELRFARRHAVLDVPDGASLSDLQRMLAPFMGQPLVAKPAHSCGGIVFLEEQPTEQEWGMLHKLAVRDYYELSRERLYRELPKRIVVEERLNNGSGALVDYKLFCSKGEVFGLLVIIDMLGSPQRFLYALPERRLLPYSLPIPKHVMDDLSYQHVSEVSHVPEHLDEMVAIAAKLSAPFDFVRIDLYDLPAGPCFGEFTFLVLGGRVPILSMELSDRLVRAVRSHAPARSPNGKHA